MKRLFLFLLGLCFFRTEVCAQYFLNTILEVEGTPGSQMQLGTGILGLGDVNNDGKSDFAVSARKIGKTFVYFGGRGVLDGIPDVTLRGGDIMVMGDLNGDGKKDLVVRQRRLEGALRDSVFVYFGRDPDPLAIDTIPGLMLIGEGINTGFGEEFGSAMDIGDLNNDEFDDLVVGAKDYGLGEGRVYIFLGRTHPGDIPDFVMTGHQKRAHFGFQIHIGEINGDDVPDLLISSDSRDTLDSNIYLGRIDIYHGRSGVNFEREQYSQRLEAIKLGTENLPWFNFVDMNNDGFMDIVCPSNRLISTYVYYGRSDSIRWHPDYEIPSPDTLSYKSFPFPIDIGDVNMDGVNDFAVIAPTVGAPGVCVFLYLGSSNPVPKAVGTRCRGFVGSLAFWNIAGLGDVNGDGVNDFGATVPAEYSGGSTDGYFIIFSGNKNFTKVEGEDSMPQDFILYQNHPNPFNPTTNIQFELPVASHVSLRVYDLLGQEIRMLVQGERSAGFHTISWDGRNEWGQSVPSGVYIYKIIMSDFVHAQKMLLVR